MKDQFTTFDCATGVGPRRKTISSMWVTSQDDPAMKITHSEGISLNGLCRNESFSPNRGYTFKGREGISLLVYACHSTLFVFSLLDFLFLLYFCYF